MIRGASDLLRRQAGRQQLRPLEGAATGGGGNRAAAAAVPAGHLFGRQAARAMPVLRAGEVIGPEGRWQVERKVGEGQFSEVYQVVDMQSREQVRAVLVPLLECMEDARAALPCVGGTGGGRDHSHQQEQQPASRRRPLALPAHRCLAACAED